MIHSPLVTVGIPCYNVERFIGFAIRSVLNQTYTNFELIITDDGSTDRTVDIIKQFDDPRIKLIVDGENHGISYRLNQQIDMAKGEYFVRMDGDDIMFPDRIEKQIKYLQANPDISVVSAQAIVIDDENRIIGRREGRDSEPYQLTFELLKKGYSLIHPTVIGKLQFFKKYYYADEYNGVEDYELWMRSCSQEKLYTLPIPVIFYRDPLTFKLNTYLFRHRQVCKLYRTVMTTKVISHSEYCWFLFRSKIKSFLAVALSFIGLDALMIKKRNTRIVNSTDYQLILHSSQNR